MLATIFLDRYGRKDSHTVAAALDEICSPKNNFGFAATGLYCYSNPKTREVLYIGESTNLSRRFRQHNGLMGCNANACKRDNIEQFFKENHAIGFSVLVQSSLSDKANDVVEEHVKSKKTGKLTKYIGGVYNVKMAESQMISLYEQLGDSIPGWNKKRGHRDGRGRQYLSGQFAKTITFVNLLRYGTLESPATPNPSYNLLENLEGSYRSFLNAHATIREVVNRPLWLSFEECLHSLRVMFINGMPEEKTLALLKSGKAGCFQPFVEEMFATGYLSREAPLGIE